jgi:hypothetical protein
MPKKIKKPEISIIIPTYNRDDFLGKTLASLINQSFKDFDVLVCDDGGTSPKTKDIALRFKKYFPTRYLRRENKENLFNPAAARDLGARNAEGKYLFFMDCDIVLLPDTLQKMYKWINFPGRNKRYHAAVGKRIHLQYEVSEDDIINNINNLQKFYIKGFSKKYEGVSLSGTGIILKKIYFEIGGFDKILFAGLRVQDLELMYRLEAFLNNKTKKLKNIVYHIDNREIKDIRRTESGRNENLGREMIKKKFLEMGFDIQGKRPVKNLAKYSQEHYDRFIEKKELMHNISQKLHQEVMQTYRSEEKKNKLDKDYNNEEKTQSPLVYIIVLNYNGLEWLKKCIPSLQKTNYSNYKILVVDNNSSDNSVEYIKKQYPKVEILQINKNLGYAGGNNKGFRHSYRMGAEYMAVLNNDVEVDSDWLKELVKVGEENFAAGAIGPQILSGDRKYIQGPMQGFNNPTYLEYNPNKIRSVKKVGKLVGCAILFKRKALEKIGLFDKTYFCYQEEYDWCQRANYHGFDLYHVPQSIIYHYGFKTSTKKKNYIYYKMYFLFSSNEIRRYLKDPNKKLFKLLKYVTFKHYLKLPNKSRNPLLYSISYLKNIIMLPEIIYRRRIEKEGGSYI